MTILDQNSHPPFPAAAAPVRSQLLHKMMIDELQLQCLLIYVVLAVAPREAGVVVVVVGALLVVLEMVLAAFVVAAGWWGLSPILAVVVVGRREWSPIVAVVVSEEPQELPPIGVSELSGR